MQLSNDKTMHQNCSEPYEEVHICSLISIEKNLEASVEVNRGTQQVVEHVRIVAGELLVDHKGEDSHLGGTAVVELDGTLLELLLLRELVPSEVDVSITEVTNELSSGDVLHDRDFKETNEADDLEDSSGLDLVEGGKTRGDIGELGARVVDGSRKTNSGGGNDVSENSQLGDTSVLELNVTEAVEAILVSIGEHTKRIEESDRGLGT